MWTRIYYDSYKNRLYCNEYENSKRKKIDFSPKFEYYVPDPTGQSDIKDIYGNSVKLQTSETRKGMKEVASCTRCCESDISEDIKFLQKRYGNKKLKVNMDNIQIATIDIEVECGSNDGFPKESEAKFPINLISVHYSKEDKVYTFGIRPYTGNNPIVQKYHYCADEKTMLERFIKHFRKKRVDCVTGWFLRNFDIPYIINRCNNLRIDVSLSPLNYYKKKRWTGYHIDESDGYEIPGISILDGMDLFKNFEKEKQVSYSLQNIGMLVVKEGKKDYDGTINDAWEKDWNGFVEYNVQDVLLVRKIEQEKKYIELTITLCYQALIPFQRIFSSITLVEGYFLKFLHSKNMVLPDHEKNKTVKKLPGAYVFAILGKHRYCLSYDAESLYPFTIMQWGISPESLKIDNPSFGKTPLSEYKNWETANGSVHIGGVYYDRENKGILCQVIEQIIKDRRIFKEKMFIAGAIRDDRDLSTYNPKLVQEVQDECESYDYYYSQQYVRKILANSMFGCAANEYFHFYNYYNAISITLGGQFLIKYMRDNFNSYMKNYFHKIVHKLYPNFKGEFEPLKNDVVVQIDTDSVFICLDEVITKLGVNFKSNQEIYDWMNNIDQKLFQGFITKILNIYANKYKFEQIMNFKREKIIINKLVTAKKKYVDQIIANEDDLYIKKPEIKYTGLEVVRTDTPIFCRTKLKETADFIIESDFDKEKVMDKIRNVYNQFLKCNISEIAIPKGINEYTKYASDNSVYLKNGLSYPKHCPIHVRAAINYNYLVASEKIPFLPITNGTKLKFVHVSTNNKIHEYVIAFINEWPKEFDKIFAIDYDKQFHRTFISVIQRIFNVLDWGEIKIEENSLSEFITF